LADFEQFTGGSIASHFGLIAGTSIGGILALALAVGVKAEKMVNLFEKHGEEIFKPRFNLRNVWRSTYTLTRLASLLHWWTWPWQQARHPCISLATPSTTAKARKL
jgi:patatin-like phospholipase/acyl hydrolase